MVAGKINNRKENFAVRYIYLPFLVLSAHIRMTHTIISDAVVVDVVPGGEEGCMLTAAPPHQYSE